MKNLPPLTTTCIGSVPFLDVDETLDLVARACPVLPAWPQFSRRAREDMVLQAVDGLPALELDVEERRVTVATAHREEALTGFYEKYLAGDLDHFAVPPEAGVGLGPMLKRAAAEPGFGPDFLKVQVIGPVSFGTTIRTPEEKNLIDDPELGDTVVKGLAAKAAWLAHQVRAAGRTPVLFIDEPGLSNFGSAFSTLSRERVIEMFNEMAQFIRERGEVLLGTHVCGNTDWGMLIDADLDIINFDAFDYLEQFLLYPDRIRRLLERGGYVLWGIVPTLRFTDDLTVDGLADRLADGWRRLAAKGIDLELIRSRALLSPSCGVGTVSPEIARRILVMLPQVAERVR